MEHNLRHDLDGATPEEQAIHLALQRETEVDLSDYATQKWVKSQGYLTSVPENPSEPIDINLDGYATIEYSDAGDNALQAQVDKEKADREVVDETLQKLIELEARDRAAGDDALSKEVGDLQKGFDTAVLAAQEGADNLNIELQSYLKKDDARTSYLSLSGGTVTGNISTQGIFKCIRSSNSAVYAVEIKPNDNTTKAFIRTDGSASFKTSLKIDGTEVSKEGHTHSGYASSSHSHSNMAILKKGTSTNPSLSQGEMYLNTSQKILYIGV